MSPCPFSSQNSVHLLLSLGRLGIESASRRLINCPLQIGRSSKKAYLLGIKAGTLLEGPKKQGLELGGSSVAEAAAFIFL